MATPPPVTAFVGLGRMGEPMALQLLRHRASLASSLNESNGSNDSSSSSSSKVLVFNRTQTATAVATLVAAGAENVTTLEEIGKRAQTVFVMVADDRASREVVDAIGAGGSSGGRIIVNMSTILPATATELAAVAATHGWAYASAPVFGRPDAARNKLLVVCSGGPDDLFERLQPDLQVGEPRSPPRVRGGIH